MGSTTHADWRDGTVDLHAHLFLYEGVGVDWFGTFAGSLEAKGSGDRWASKVNEEALERSGFSIIVLALYTHPVFRGSPRDAIGRQLEAAKKFVEAHPRWIIARSSDEAERALASGKKVLLLALEGAAGILDEESDVEEWIDRQGIRVVGIQHFTADRFGGGALMPSVLGLLSPVAWIRSFFGPRTSDNVRGSPYGMTPDGRVLLKRLLKKKVWIDLAHSSDAVQQEVIPILREARQPILHSHTVLRRYYGAERGITYWQLEAIKASGGLVGVIPSEDMLRGTVVTGDYCHPGCGPCNRGITTLQSQFFEISTHVGSSSVSIGSDINAPISLISADTCPSRTKKPGPDYFNYGQMPQIWHDLEAVVATPGEPARLTVERFLLAWKQVEAAP